MLRRTWMWLSSFRSRHVKEKQKVIIWAMQLQWKWSLFNTALHSGLHLYLQQIELSSVLTGVCTYMYWSVHARGGVRVGLLYLFSFVIYFIHTKLWWQPWVALVKTKLQSHSEYSSLTIAQEHAVCNQTSWYWDSSLNKKLSKLLASFI